MKEIKITKLPSGVVATVEFAERVRNLLRFLAKILIFHQESIPPALTKDKKRLNEQEISVNLAWKSTLYVTNFPESADDSDIRNLFGKASFSHCSPYMVFLTVITSLELYLMSVGPVKNSRAPVGSVMFSILHQYAICNNLVRVILTSVKDAANRALQMHGYELQPDVPLNVFISDPERKKERSDQGANEKEIYVAGLSKFATTADLEKIFSTVSFGQSTTLRSH